MNHADCPFDWRSVWLALTPLANQSPWTKTHFSVQPTLLIICACKLSVIVWKLTMFLNSVNKNQFQRRDEGRPSRQLIYTLLRKKVFPNHNAQKGKYFVLYSFAFFINSSYLKRDNISKNTSDIHEHWLPFCPAKCKWTWNQYKEESTTFDKNSTFYRMHTVINVFYCP